jgi:peptidyl-prolyl cis-trans isomerase B (cyclophilin B)
MITLKTSMGDIVIELDHEKAPKSCENFEQYVRDGHYDGTIFHRVINNFMIQGGGFMPDMMQKATRDPIENEAANGLSNVNGSIAMARTAAPHSATAQFFINVKDNGFLDHPGQDGWGYCVFGKVTSGMDVVEKMKTVETTNKAGHSDVPAEPIVIEQAEISDPE